MSARFVFKGYTGSFHGSLGLRHVSTWCPYLHSRTDATLSRTNRTFSANIEGEGENTAAPASLEMRIYKAANCPLCDGLAEKLEALRERGKFQSDIWSTLNLQTVDVDSSEELRKKYRMRIPVLEYMSDGGWKELPFQSPRLTADALGKRLEKWIL